MVNRFFLLTSSHSPRLGIIFRYFRFPPNEIGLWRLKDSNREDGGEEFSDRYGFLNSITSSHKTVSGSPFSPLHRLQHISRHIVLLQVSLSRFGNCVKWSWWMLIEGGKRRASSRLTHNEGTKIETFIETSTEFEINFISTWASQPVQSNVNLRVCERISSCWHNGRWVMNFFSSQMFLQLAFNLHLFVLRQQRGRMGYKKLLKRLKLK